MRLMAATGHAAVDGDPRTSSRERHQLIKDERQRDRHHHLGKVCAKHLEVCRET